MGTKVRVLDLVGTDVAGLRAQVRQEQDSPDWRSAWRTLKKVEQRKIAGSQWIYVYWEPVNPNEMGFRDCGFSGRWVDIADDWEIEIEAERR